MQSRRGCQNLFLIPSLPKCRWVCTRLRYLPSCVWTVLSLMLFIYLPLRLHSAACALHVLAKIHRQHAALQSLMFVIVVLTRLARTAQEYHANCMFWKALQILDPEIIASVGKVCAAFFLLVNHLNLPFVSTGLVMSSKLLMSTTCGGRSSFFCSS